MAEFKMTDFNKYLSDKDRDFLVKELKTLAKNYPDVKEHFLHKMNPDSEKQIMEKYKEIIYNEFFPKRGFGKLRFSVMRKALSDFRKICTSSENMAELMVSYIEGGIKFTNTYGDIDEHFYNAILKMQKQVFDYILDNNLSEVFDKRLKKIVIDGDGIGWDSPMNCRKIIINTWLIKER